MNNLICPSCGNGFDAHAGIIDTCKRAEKYKQALIDIRKHQEMISGKMAKINTIWNIANRALD